MQIKTETKVGIFVIIAIGIFMFMTLGIGAFKFGTYGYSPYKVAFKDVSGLSRKADVKVAGVKVGWVEDIELNDSGKAIADIMVDKKYNLYDNAYAVVRQEGLIGTKYLEVTPGDPMLPKLESGDRLARPGREAVSVDELLFKFKTIASHVEQITDSMKEAFTGSEKTDQLKTFVENMSGASAKIDKLATSLEKIVTNNEDAMVDVVKNMQEITQTLKTDLPSIKDKLSDSSDSIAHAAKEAREGFENIASVTQKLDDGRGLLGKLINEEEMYKDIKSAVSGVKNYLGKFESLGVIFDAHTETFQRPVDDFPYTDSKGYLNVRVHTNDNFFYLLQVASSEKGFVTREYRYKTYLDSRHKDYQEIPFSDISTDSNDAIANAINEHNRRAYAPQTIEQVRAPFAYGFQFGKVYGNMSFRVGMFEGAFGAGVDYFIPMPNEKFSWITTLEVFDFKGLQRLEINEQRRPHLKWINKVFLFNNIYTTMGVDDFVSKNATLFWGFGLRFADDDIKYLISKIGIGMPSQ